MEDASQRQQLFHEMAIDKKEIHKIMA